MQIWLNHDQPEQQQLIKISQALGGHEVTTNNIDPNELLLLDLTNCSKLLVTVSRAIVWATTGFTSSGHLRNQLNWIQHFVVIVPSSKIKHELIEAGFADQQLVVMALPSGHSAWLADQVPSYQQTAQPYALTNNSLAIQAWQLAQRGGFVQIDQQTADERTILAISMFAGMPIAAATNTVGAELVSKTACGITYSDEAMLKGRLAKTTAQEYQAYSHNARHNAQLINSGIGLRHALLTAIDQLSSQHDYSNDHPRYGIQVMNSNETLDYIAQHHCSVARLGDGEISLLLGTAQVFQDEDPVLRKRLDEIVKTASNDKLLVCLSDTFHDLGRYVPAAQDWWNGHLNVFHDYYQELGQLHHRYGNTMVTRAYMDLQDRTGAGKIFQRIKQWWQDRDVLIVEGRFTRSGVGNDLYDNAKSVKRIICPSKNAWSKYQEIEAAIKKYGQGKLVLVMLGMAATVIAADLADWGQVIDSGHLDPEYEWYKMGATSRVPIPGKHTAEMNYDQGVPQEIADPQYQSQIVLNLDN